MKPKVVLENNSFVLFWDEMQRGQGSCPELHGCWRHQSLSPGLSCLLGPTGRQCWRGFPDVTSQALLPPSATACPGDSFPVGSGFFENSAEVERTGSLMELSRK